MFRYVSFDAVYFGTEVIISHISIRHIQRCIVECMSFDIAYFGA
jgi:hypothetical protein